METLRGRDVEPGSAVHAEVVGLYLEAFPPEERIELEVLDELACERSVAFSAYYDDDLFCGFSYSIDTGDYLYVMFLAVSAAKRSRGYGTRILDQLKERFPGRVIILEIEPVNPCAPNARQRQARFAFYKRNGFSPTGFESVDGALRYTLLATPGPFKPASFIRDVSRITRTLPPLRLEKAH